MEVADLGPLMAYARGRVAEAWAERMAAMAAAFAPRAEVHDRDGTVAAESLADLRAAGYPGLTAPREEGGEGAGLADLCLLQAILATGDAPTALGLGWHLSLLLGLRATGAWPEEARRRVFRAAVAEGALINSCASERETGSPSRGGRPTTRAEPTAGGYRLSGRKTFATFSPVLRWFLVPASLEDGTVGEFLVEAGTPGVRVEETWDTLGMRATASHDLVLEGATVDEDALVERYRPPERSRRSADAGGPLLHVPACYLGIALAARRELVAFAWRHRPNSLPGPIAEVAAVEEQVGRMEMALLPALAFLFDAAAAWDAADAEGRAALRHRLAAAKVAGTEAAVAAVDIAMRVVGGLSLSRRLPFERFYRDVRAGLHNPPMGDMAVRALGRAVLAEGKPPVSP
ncbi:MAG: acyl-CoA/acyl-ACP dehydrogenase [Firmicutes bacterium]|nr:acyl-CoA/acyl-ACP dehydrogenase [Bacillota bacterium]